MPQFRRRLVLIAGSALLSLSAVPATLAADWQSVAPEAAGFAPDLADRLDRAVRDGRLPNLHAVLVARGGRLVLERYLDLVLVVAGSYHQPDAWKLPVTIIRDPDPGPAGALR